MKIWMFSTVALSLSVAVNAQESDFVRGIPSPNGPRSGDFGPPPQGNFPPRFESRPNPPPFLNPNRVDPRLADQGPAPRNLPPQGPELEQANNGAIPPFAPRPPFGPSGANYLPSNPTDEEACEELISVALDTKKMADLTGPHQLKLAKASRLERLLRVVDSGVLKSEVEEADEILRSGVSDRYADNRGELKTLIAELGSALNRKLPRFKYNGQEGHILRNPLDLDPKLPASNLGPVPTLERFVLKNLYANRTEETNKRTQKVQYCTYADNTLHRQLVKFSKSAQKCLEALRNNSAAFDEVSQSIQSETTEQDTTAADDDFEIDGLE